jgi:hypothetical protein
MFCRHILTEGVFLTQLSIMLPAPVAGLRRRSRPLAYCDHEFESNREHGCLSVVCVVR